MTKKRRISDRELWLVCLLPAALVMIVSLGLPKGEAGQIPDMERRLSLLSSEEAVQRRGAQLRELNGELADVQETLNDLNARRVQLQGDVDDFRTTGSQSTSAMAQGLDALTRTLGDNGIQVLGMTPLRSGNRIATSPAVASSTSAAGSSVAEPRRLRSSRRARRASVGINSITRGASSSARGSTVVVNSRYWEIDVAASWSAMGAVLARPDAFPPGMALSALTMDPARPSTRLRRWQLTVADAGLEP
ncbi:MAG: hypothetical protein AAGJ52_05815 [Pseudomonadota bacterium]